MLCLIAQLCPTLQPHGLQSARLPRPWDSPVGSKVYGQQQKFYTDPAKKEYCAQCGIPLYEIWYDQDILSELKRILQDNSVLSSDEKEKV